MDFRCCHCPGRFTRLEHLTRHVRSHTREKPYQCTTCGKCFARQDVRNRHAASHAADAADADACKGVVSSRACTACAVGRVRCSKESPCRRCRARNLPCVYPRERERKQPPPPPPAEDPEIQPPVEPASPLLDTEDSAWPQPSNPDVFDLNWLSPGPMTDGWDYGLASVYEGLDPGGFLPDRASLPQSTCSPDTVLERTGPGAAAEAAVPSGTLYVDGDGARAPFQGRLQRSRSTASSCTPGTDTELLVSEAIYDSMCREMRVFDADVTVSLDQVRGFTRLYFDRFHPAYPFVRPDASALQGQDGWILLLALSTAGAHYALAPQAASMLHLVRAVLDSRPPQDDEELWAPCEDGTESDGLAGLQAELLCLACMLHSGQTGLVNRALERRVYLADECRRGRLLAPDSRESAARVGAMIWLLDAATAFEFDCAPCLQLHDFESALPCRDAWGQPNPPAATMQEALQTLYMRKTLPETSEFGLVLLICAVQRRTGEASYQHRHPLCGWTPSAAAEAPAARPVVAETWPPALPVLARWRNSACDCLDMIHWHANGTAAQAGGWEHPTILHLHLARLLLLAPVRHIEAVARRRCRQHDTAIRHMRQWAGRDQYKARLAIVHAGALLWHVRRYSTDGFLEPFCIYLATLVVWSYSLFRPPGPAEPDAEPDAELPDPAFIHLDRPCDDEMVQAYVRTGHRMQGHMARVGDICAAGAPQRLLQEGLRMLAEEGAWGSRQAYAERLRRLI